jgi:hypothetical protein
VTVDLPRRAVAEFLGTALLLATVIGSGIMAAKLAGGNGALALLCNTIPTGAILAVLILIFGPVSGAHLNPAVTLAFVFRRELSAAVALAYLAVQVAGAIAGAWLAHLMFDLPVLQLSTKLRSGVGQWFARSGHDLWLGAHDFRMRGAYALRGSLRGRALHHRRLLVHRVDLVRQPGGHARTLFKRHVRGHPTGGRAGLHYRAASGRGCGDGAAALARADAAGRGEGCHSPTRRGGRARALKSE